MSKTNAVRILEKAGIDFTLQSYPIDPNDLSGEHAARSIGIPIEQVFKTLVLIGAKGGHFVCVLPCHETVDLRLAAQAAGEKKVEMIAMKDLLAITGYVRGGCSPIGMKRPFPIFLDETALLFDKIAISAGARGMMSLLSPTALVDITKATIHSLIAY